MKLNVILRKIIPLFFTIVLISCASRKDLVYYQNIDSINQKEKTNTYEVTIQPDDLLMIIVSAEDPEIAAPFNLTTVSVANPTNPTLATGMQTMQSYLVNSEGFIQFPVLG